MTKSIPVKKRNHNIDYKEEDCKKQQFHGTIIAYSKDKKEVVEDSIVH